MKENLIEFVKALSHSHDVATIVKMVLTKWNIVDVIQTFGSANPQVLTEKIESLLKEQEAEPQITKEEEDGIIKWRFKTSSPFVALVPIADLHFGKPLHREKFWQDVNAITSVKNVYVILGGDLIDNSIKTVWGVDFIIEATPIKEQLLAAKNFIETLGDRILAIISGNHELWSLKAAGIDLYEVFLAYNLTHLYRRNIAFIKLQVNDITYQIGIAHKYRYNSSLNLTHTVKRFVENAPLDLDVGIVCHHHEPDAEYFYKRGKQRVAIRPGSYLKRDGYAISRGYLPAPPLFPSLLLSTQERKMWILPDVQDAILVLKLTADKRYSEIQEILSRIPQQKQQVKQMNLPQRGGGSSSTEENNAGSHGASKTQRT